MSSRTASLVRGTPSERTSILHEVQGIDYRRIAVAHDRQTEWLLEELGTVKRRLSLARAGLLVALGALDSPPARALVGYALELTGGSPTDDGLELDVDVV